MSEHGVVFYSWENWKEIHWQMYRNGELIREYITPLMPDTRKYVKNIDTTLYFVALDDVLLPYTINEKEYENSYVCSPYNHYITYAKEELAMLNNKVLEKPLSMLLHLIGNIAKRLEINKVVYMNNWLLSTNLSPKLTEEQLIRLKQACVTRYPNHLFCYRSMNTCLYPEMMNSFKKQQYQLLPSRYVYISSFQDYSQLPKKMRRELNQDRKLLEKGEFEVVSHDDFTKEDLNRAKWLYDMLYLEKYSYQNPNFTTDYIHETHKRRTLMYMGLKKNGILQGVFATKILDDQMATPVLGYNTDLPQEHGLYRILCYLSGREAVKHERIYHQSAGVGQFKYNRGAKGFPEYCFTP